MFEKETEEYVESLTKDWSDGEYSFDLNDIRQAFLAGLKAGRPQWHDLRKKPNDLPKEGTEVLNDDGVKVVRINGHWRYVYGGEWEDDAHLDHWCEVPTFDME